MEHCPFGAFVIPKPCRTRQSKLHRKSDFRAGIHAIVGAQTEFDPASQRRLIAQSFVKYDAATPPDKQRLGHPD